MKTKHWIILFAVLALVCVGLSAWLFGANTNAQSIQIFSDGRLIETLPLSIDRTIVVEGENGRNTVCIENGAVAVIHADCPDQHCVNRGFCTGGAQIVCLPNRLVIAFGSGQTVDGLVG